LKKELAGLDGTGGTALPGHLLSKKLDLELQLPACKIELEMLCADQEAKRQRLQEILELQAEAAPLTRQVDRFESECARLQLHIDQLRVLASMAGGEMAITQPAMAVERPFGSARRWLFGLATMIGALGLWQCGLVTYQARRRANSNQGAVAEIGLPVVAHVPVGQGIQALEPEANTLIARGIRSLAFFLRQRLPNPGSTILFTPINGGLPTRSLIVETAAYLARWDEKVLILETALVDACETRSGGAGSNEGDRDWLLEPAALAAASGKALSGLSDYLASDKDSLSDMICHTRIHGVDFMPPGTARLVPGSLPTTRMSQLMEQLRKSYTIILVDGPPFGSTSAIYMLAPYQDGIIVLLDGVDAAPTQTRETMQTYMQRGLPFVGCVSITEESTPCA
jgi:hypothetical protein